MGIPANPTTREILATFHPAHGAHTVMEVKLHQSGQILLFDCSCGRGVAVTALCTSRVQWEFSTVVDRLKKLGRLGRAKKAS